MSDLLTRADANISACGLYRSWLSRMWDPTRDDPTREHALFIMLNPSTADASKDDPTIRRCVGFARHWGCTGVVVVNLFQLRATDPDKLLCADVPLNPTDADSTITAAVGQTHVIVAAWGALHPSLRYRVQEVAELVASRGRHLHHLGLTKAGDPRHPLYLPKAARLELYSAVSK